MTKRKSNLKNITPHRLFSRLRETGLLEVRAPTSSREPSFARGGCLGLTFLGQLAGATSQRDIEFLGQRLHPSLRRGLRLKRAPSDTTLQRAIASLDHATSLRALQRQVRAMHKRGELVEGSHGFHQVAIDGKQVHWFSSQDVDHPAVQPQSEHGSTLRVLRATHVGAGFSTCILQSAIPAVTNELGHLSTFLDELTRAYGRSTFIRVLSTDAGLCSRECAAHIHEQGWEYLMRLKGNQPGLCAEARRTLTGRPFGVLRSEGGTLEHRLWVHDLEGAGWLDWEHAGSFLRIERVRCHEDGEELLGERLWVSSLRGLELEQWAGLCRGHWGCENGQHCVVDKHFGEDQRLGQLSRDPEALLAVSVLRAMAVNVLNVLRIQRRNGYRVKRSYKQARQQVSSALEQEWKSKESRAFA